MSIPYTYYLFHVPTGKKYYGYQGGQESDPFNLWTIYFSSSKLVGALIEEYGKDSFKFEVRKTFDTTEEAFNWEQKVLKRIKAVEREDWLNQSLANGPFFRFGPHSDKTKEKIGNANRGFKHSEETKNKISMTEKGRIFSEETKRKISEAKKGKLHPHKGYFPSENTKKKMSEARRGKIPWNKGKKGLQISWNKGLKMPPMSEEHKMKISISNKGKKKKIGISNKGKKKKVVACPVCGKLGGIGAMHRWHFNNCEGK